MQEAETTTISDTGFVESEIDDETADGENGIYVCHPFSFWDCGGPNSF